MNKPWDQTINPTGLNSIARQMINHTRLVTNVTPGQRIG
jgi:hypothetical protein